MRNIHFQQLRRAQGNAEKYTILELKYYILSIQSSLPCCSVSVSPSFYPLCVFLQVSRPQILVLCGLFREARCLLPHLSKMLQLPCYIPIAA